MVQIYGHQTWTGTIYDKHSGVMSKVDACYKKKKKVFVIFFECDNFEIVLQVKRKIRDLFGMENHSIHISDNYLETRYISQLLLNPNSFHHLCFGNPDKHVCINEKLEECKNMNTYRLYGELITANLYKIKNVNISQIKLENYYDNNATNIVGSLTVSLNGKEYFKENIYIKEPKKEKELKWYQKLIKMLFNKEYYD